MGTLDAQLADAVEDVRAAAQRLVDLFGVGSDALSPEVAGRLVATLGSVERILMPVRAGCASRAAVEPAVWGRDGSASPAEWLARQRGVETGTASSELLAAARLSTQPEVRAAALRGELSGEQIGAITAAVEADPSASERLLSEVAAGESLARLREHCRDVRAKASPAGGLERRRWERRWARLTIDDEGGTAFRMCGPATDRPRVEAVLGPLVERFFLDDRRSGRRRSFSARLYDAALTAWGVPLVEPPVPDGRGGGPVSSSARPPTVRQPGASAPVTALSVRKPLVPDGDRADGELPLAIPEQSTPTTAPIEAHCAAPAAVVPGTSPRRTVGSVRVSHSALLQGRCAPGDVCDWNGTDPLPLDAVRALLPGAFVSVVVTRTDGTVSSVGRLGRAVSRKDGAWEWMIGGPQPAGRAMHRGTAIEWLVQVHESTLVGVQPEDGSFLGTVAARAQPVEELTGPHRCFRGAQLTVLNWMQPTCAVIGCNRTVCTQHDHRVEFELNPVSDVDNADRLCPHHHRLKTHHGYRLEPGRGRRRLLPPPTEGRSRALPADRGRSAAARRRSAPQERAP